MDLYSPMSYVIIANIFLKIFPPQEKKLYQCHYVIVYWSLPSSDNKYSYNTFSTLG